jgi:thioredoxin-like negative regulator of GroEL
MEFNEIVAEVTDENHAHAMSCPCCVLGFFSEYDMDCLMALPIMESLAEEFGEKVFFGKVNVEECHDIKHCHGVTRVPCAVIFKQGEKIAQVRDLTTEDYLKELLVRMV